VQLSRCTDGRYVLLEAVTTAPDSPDMRLDVRDLRDVKGQVFVSRGNIDWATCDNQRVDMKSLLVDALQAKPAEIARSLKQGSGAGGVSALEEMIRRRGIEPQALLHQCVDAHVASALAAIAEMVDCTHQISNYERGDALLSASNSWHVLVGAHLLHSAVASDAVPVDGGSIDRVATAVFSLPGVEGVLVFDGHGALRAARCKPETQNRLGDLLGAAIDHDYIVERPRLGALSSLVIEHERATIIRREMSGARGLTVLLMVESTGRVGALRHRLERLDSELAEHDATQQRAERNLTDESTANGR
jgi:hypothetical protein